MTEQPAHVQRMQAESDALQDKITKLGAFVESETFEGLGELDRGLLLIQRDAMVAYANALCLRLNRAEGVPA